MSQANYAGLSIEQLGHVGVIHLDRAQNLNALSIEMIEGLHQQVLAWQHDASIQGIIIRSNSPKAFCAGGDIRYLYDNFKAGRTEYQDYFAAEYAMLMAIRQSTKVVIALLDGYVLGGGMGLAQACHVRISSEKSRFAMPETAIGYFPDVGATYFLSRLNAIGLYMALSSAQIDYKDALALKCIDAYVPSAEFDDMYQALIKTPWQDQAQVRSIIAPFSQALEGLGELAAYQTAIETHFNFEDLQQIESSLAQEQDPDRKEWAAQLLQRLSQCSYLAKQCSLQLHWAGRQLNLQDAMQVERDLQAQWFEHGDLIEGVRALLVDKDKQPKWQQDNPALLKKLQQILAPYVQSA